MFSFIRGDTFSFSCKILFENGDPIKKGDIDDLFVTVKRGIDTKVIFQKNKEQINLDSDGTMHVVFEPIDTENLKLGTYIFDIEVTLHNGIRKTKTGQFQLLFDVTTHREGDDKDGN